MIVSKPISCAGACIAICAGGWIGGGLVKAAPVMGNLQQPAVDGTEAISLHQWQASAFRLSPEAGAWRVSSLTARLAQRVANRSFSFRIVSESAFRPDLSGIKVLFTTPPVAGTGTQNVTFTALTTPTPVLQPGQTYWLVAGISGLDENETTSTGLYHWSFSKTMVADGTPQPGWFLDSQIATSGTLGLGWTPEAASPFSFSLDASPEHASMTLARWRELHPGGASDPAVYLAADHDQNGLNGLLDFAFDANPENLPFLSRDAATGKLFLEYIRWVDAPELTWQLENSPNQMGWIPLDGLTFSTSAAGPLSQRVRTWLPETGPRQFYRISVVKN